MPESQRERCAKYGRFLRSIRLIPPEEETELTNWLSALSLLLEACSFLPNLSNMTMTIFGDFFRSSRGYEFVRKLLANSNGLRNLNLVFYEESELYKLRETLHPILDKLTNIRCVRLDCPSTRADDFGLSDLPLSSINELTDTLATLKSLTKLRLLALPKQWAHPVVFVGLSLLTNIIRISFDYSDNFCPSGSGGRDKRRDYDGTFKSLEALSFPSLPTEEISELIAQFPLQHPLKQLKLNNYIHRTLVQPIIKHFPDLQYLEADALGRDEDGLTPLTWGKGFVPLKALDLVVLRIRGCVISTQDLMGALDSWPNLECLALTGPKLTTLAENIDFNLWEDPESFATSMPLGLTLEVLGKIAQAQKKIKSLSITIVCDDTSQLLPVNHEEKFASSLERLKLENSFYNCRYESFHHRDAAEYITSLIPANPGFKLSIVVEDDEDEDEMYNFIDLEEYERYTLWHKLLCERIERHVLRAWVAELGQQLTKAA